jgi:hypothetical protein
MASKLKMDPKSPIVLIVGKFPAQYSKNAGTRALSELSRIAVSMLAKENLDAEASDDVLARRIFAEADPQFVEELGRALAHQRLILWIQGERRRVQRIKMAKQHGADQRAG